MQVSDFHQSGNQARWNLTCSGQMQVSGTARRRSTAMSFTGRMNLSVQMGGDQSVPMVQNFTARRVGECQYVRVVT
jgi:hypothetical protein